MSEFLDQLRDCVSCPRRCHADRMAGRLGYCRSGPGFAVGSICLHRGEEPVFGGGAVGICNVFFSRCNLQCVYCQNYQISRNYGPIAERVLDIGDVVREIEAILDTGVRQVGFVSPSHCIPQMRALIAALERRRPRPIFVMNTNGYDSVETLRALEGVVDVYLPDLKYMDSALAARLSGASDYPRVAAAALREMRRQKGAALHLDGDGLAVSGIVVRHLVLPGQVENSLRCLQFLAEDISSSISLSLLSQYRPTLDTANDPDLRRPLRHEEYDAVLEEMERLGFHRGWTQQLDSVDAYTPDFDRDHPFE